MDINASEYDKYTQELKNDKSILDDEIDKANSYKATLEKMGKITIKDCVFSSPDEQEVFNKLLSCIDTKKYMLWGQVSFSAFLSNQQNEDWKHYNKFYVDFLVIEKESKKPCLVIEYYGAKQHKMGKVRARDNFRKAICNKAGLDFVELKKIEEVEQLKEYKSYQDYITKSLAKFKEVLK